MFCGLFWVVGLFLWVTYWFSDNDVVGTSDSCSCIRMLAAVKGPSHRVPRIRSSDPLRYRLQSRLLFCPHWHHIRLCLYTGRFCVCGLKTGFCLALGFCRGGACFRSRKLPQWAFPSTYWWTDLTCAPLLLFCLRGFTRGVCLEWDNLSTYSLASLAHQAHTPFAWMPHTS